MVSVLAAVLFPSCGKKCCNCVGSEIYMKDICEDTMPVGFTSWDACRSALREGGCICE